MYPMSTKLVAFALAVLGVSVGAIAATQPGPSGGASDTVVGPGNLNLQSHGNFVTAVLKNASDLPSDADASDLTATATISVGGAAVSVNATVRAYDPSNHTVVVKIDRQEIAAAILEAVASGLTVEDPITVSVTVTGGGASVTRTGLLDWFSHR